MHIAITIWVIVASIRWGDWKNWERYYSTMLYIASANLLYQFFAQKYFILWEVQEELFLNQSMVVMLHTFVINPLAAFIFLSNFPDRFRKQIIHIIKWIIIFISVEWAGLNLGKITHSNGWNLGWSTFFVLVMLPMLVLHYKRKIWVLVVSVFFVLFYLYVFEYI
ncbi:hypothetical protein GCM10007216_04170 [Thalassobacillus devorans]|uniref:Uncharacterized protein n=1 Tax=Thalassobacillus devorans TaxID=279813 RepID=A0ABQ1NGS7_9BACI|nr:CBO0543 family protein [Thalassobacillus devorans]NIK27326.1 hypothetical protein [Thalassobacillus devorans]GGC76820.1 hypothetical protein GCM10007216_04170 [Thalassobacillus devorans]